MGEIEFLFLQNRGFKAMKKSDFRMMCEECGSDGIVIYSSVQQSMIGYYCTKCRQIYMFDGYSRLDTFEKDLERLREEYKKS